MSSNIEDLEFYVYTNRERLLPCVERPRSQESSCLKRASKTYWKKLTTDYGMSTDEIYKLIVESEENTIMQLKNEIAKFLTR